MAVLDRDTEVKPFLNITTTTHDAELTSFIARAEAAIARKVGPLVSTATTSRLRGGTSALLLPTVPAISLTSVTPVDGTALTVGDLYLDGAAGVVTFKAGGSFADRAYDVVYAAGRTACPDDLKMAVLELIRHLWSSQRGPTQRPGSPQFDGAANTLVGAGYLLPFRVQELIAPHLQPGFA